VALEFFATNAEREEKEMNRLLALSNIQSLCRGYRRKIEET
jgi:hypothetical protein